MLSFLNRNLGLLFVAQTIFVSGSILLVTVGGTVAFVTLLFLFVAEPLWNELLSQRAQLQSQRELLTWMQESAAEARQLRTAGSTSSSGGGNQAPYLIVDSAVRRSGLPAPSRLEPKGKDGAALQYEAVPFDRLLQLFGELNRRGDLEVVDVSITRRDVAAVGVTVSVRRP